ncbi:inorganic phosphate transporter family protein [bacterium]|nr:inorganic phosphate transporter family protein [bacterium]
MYLLLLIAATIFLAYSNGANDNFKGVATLFGSRTTNYKTAIHWATVTTFMGSICSVLLAQTLLKTFSGKGLVPDTLTVSPEFLIAVAVGAATTVMLATVTGFPISTTHSLTGALLGAGFAAVGIELHFAVLGNKFFLPLLLSPLLAITLSSLAYIFFRYWRLRFGVTEEWVLYVDQQKELVPIQQPTSVFTYGALREVEPPIRGGVTHHERQYAGRMLGIPVQTLLDKAHFLSAGLVSFARGLNDTPKIAAMLLVVSALEMQWGVAMIGVAIAAGGLINARKVAETMSKKITTMNHGQGFTANLITGFLVIVASRLGLPVSTTHVSVGSLAGIGLATRGANRKVLSNILLSWVLTLPIAALLSGVTYLLVN